MDSTIINVECLDELADYAGLKAEIAEITERAMRGELEFEGALRERVGMLKGLATTALQQAYDERVRLNPGAKSLLATMREMSGPKFAWRTEIYEFVSDPIAIDLLFGSDRERKHLEAGNPWRELLPQWEVEEAAFTHRRHMTLLYD